LPNVNSPRRGSVADARKEWPINVAEVTNNPFVPKPYTAPIH